MKNKSNKKDKKTSKIKIIFISLVLLLIIGVICLYVFYRPVQIFIDEKVLGKVLLEENAKTLNIENNINAKVLVYDEYIGLMSNNNLKIYNKNLNIIGELSIAIAKPIYVSCGKYLGIAEENGNKIYLVEGKEIVWQKEVDGTINKITLNNKGMMAVSVSQISYKTVIETLDKNGKEICKTYLSETYGTDMKLSNNGKFMAIVEVDLSGIQINYGIRIIDLSKVKNNEEAIVYKENFDNKEIVIDVNYNMDNDLVCMLNDKIVKIENNQKKICFNYDSNTQMVSVNMAHQYAVINKNIIDDKISDFYLYRVKTNSIKKYIIDGKIETLFTKNNVGCVIADNVIYFINGTGFLNTKYVTTNEIKEIILSEKIAVILYRNKITLIEI